MLDKPCISGIPSKKHSCYQPVTDCSYWPVFFSFNNWNIILLPPKSTTFEAFDEIHQVFLDSISDYMASLIQSVKYDFINTYDTTANKFYVIQFISEAYRLQNNTRINGHIISAGELVVKSQYICSIQENTDWCWKQQSLQQNIIVPTRTILHQFLDVVRITDVQDIPETVCNRIQGKKSIQRHPIFMTDADYDYILDEIERWYKIEFERM